MERLPTAPRAPLYFVDGVPLTPTPPDEYRRVMSRVRELEADAEARQAALAARCREEAAALSHSSYRLETARIWEGVAERRTKEVEVREALVTTREWRLEMRERR